MISIRSFGDAVSKTTASHRLRLSGQHHLHQVQIVFGARDRNCAGSGICTAKELLGKQERSAQGGCRGCNTTKAKVQIVGRYLVFTFPSLCPRLIQQYFHEDRFLMECSTGLELSVKGKRVTYVLPQGDYPVSRRDHSLVVKIPAARICHQPFTAN